MPENRDSVYLLFFGNTILNFSLICNRVLSLLYRSLHLDFLTTKAMMIQLIDAIAQNEAKLRSPIMINVSHLVASVNCPNMEIGTAIPTKIDKTSVALKEPKELFPLLSLYLPFIPL